MHFLSLNPILNTLQMHTRGQEITYTAILVFMGISLSFLIYAFIEKSKNNKMLKSVEQMRSEIFTKITHEFRTPLTIILGLSRQLRNQKDISSNNAQTYLNAIERQGKNLSELVNQLLDISNLQTAPKPIEWKTGNIVAFVEMVSETFRIYASEKDIELFYFSDEKIIETDFVPDYLNKILRNLINNAIKYSEAGSRIYVVLEKNTKSKNHVTIKVIDHGQGISKENLPNIFNLFYQINPNNEKPDSGNGIGLTLTKQLVEILGGTIHVESNSGNGTQFIIKLPLHTNEKILYPYWTRNKRQNLNTIIDEKDKADSEFNHNIEENDPRIKILLAEDNKDIALYIRSIFPKDSFNIYYATNGEQAIEIANENIPDIILTDVIMPKKSGLELCQEIKQSPLLNHIPIIIFSAKNTDEDARKGYECGADSYIGKPFQAEELKSRVKTLLQTRNLLKDKFRRTITKNANEPETNNEDVDFLRHVTDIIYREMKNAEFSPTILAQEIAISVSQLNKKLNAIVEVPSSTYILQVKLSHAKKILSTQNKSISEVATDCGIYDVNYFSRVFKKHVGITPSQYRKLPQNQTVQDN